MPLKFGAEVVTHFTCARARLRVEDRKGREAEGWGETPLSVTWAWPGQLSYNERHEALQDFCGILARAWADYGESGHPIEVGHGFQSEVLPGILKSFNADRAAHEQMPWLAALVCCSLFDIALHDAFGVLHGIDVYDTYHQQYMNADLSHYLTPAEDADGSFAGKYPSDFLVDPRADKMPAWHLVGGLDPLDASELTGDPIDDGYPVALTDWIQTDGLKCLKVKLRGTDAAWDYERLVKIGKIGIEQGVEWLCADFNCLVTDPSYVNDILDRLKADHPRVSDMILYVEQPFPYELEENRIDVHGVSARKPLLMDESAHNWRLVKLGRELGWSGVALKTCKTQTEALLTLCWAKAHGMSLMVQDLTNPMLAQIPHVLLAARAGTMMGVETNGMQYVPDASTAEARVHPEIYRRREGCVDLSTIRGPGFGYRLGEIERKLPEPAARFG